MKRKNYILPVICLIVLIGATLACGGGSDPTDEAPQAAATEEPMADPTDEPQAEPTEEAAPSPTEEAQEPTEEPDTVETEFPLPEDAENVTEMGGNINFQTSLSLEEVAEFYREAITAMGYTEREITTVISEDVVNLVFDDPDGGESIVIQAIPMEDYTNVGIRYEDV